MKGGETRLGEATQLASFRRQGAVGFCRSRVLPQREKEDQCTRSQVERGTDQVGEDGRAVTGEGGGGKGGISWRVRGHGNGRGLESHRRLRKYLGGRTKG